MRSWLTVAMLLAHGSTTYAGTETTGAALAQVFTRRESRRQRRSDGTITVGGQRFELPNRYRHLTSILVRYAQWDLDQVFLAHDESDRILERLLPSDRAGNASGDRREIEPVIAPAAHSQEPAPLPPLLQAALAAARATGLPPAFMPPGSPTLPSPSLDMP